MDFLRQILARDGPIHTSQISLVFPLHASNAFDTHLRHSLADARATQLSPVTHNRDFAHFVVPADYFVKVEVWTFGSWYGLWTWQGYDSITSPVLIVQLDSDVRGLPVVANERHVAQRITRSDLDSSVAVGAKIYYNNCHYDPHELKVAGTV